MAVCYDTKNFGSQLQVFATIKKVEECECKVEIIRYNKRITPTFIIQTIPRLFNVSFLKSKLSGSERDKKLKQKPELMVQVKQRNQRFDEFVEEYFSEYFSEPYNGYGFLTTLEVISIRWNLHRMTNRRLLMRRALVLAKFRRDKKRLRQGI